MNRFFSAMGPLALVVVGACGSPSSPAAYALADAASDVTSAPNDVLFTIQNAAGSSDPLTSLTVNLQPAGGARMQAVFTVADTNSNGNFDPGEVMTVSEPPINWFDSSMRGPFSVELMFLQPSGIYLARQSFSWTDGTVADAGR